VEEKINKIVMSQEDALNRLKWKGRTEIRCKFLG